MICSTAHGVVFWLSSNLDDGSYTQMDPLGEINETNQVGLGAPFTLTIWATLEGLADLNVVSLDINYGGSDEVGANAVWLDNPALNSPNTYRHQITFMSQPEDFHSGKLPLEGTAFPLCDASTCHWDPDIGSFGAASLDGYDVENRTGVGIGTTAKSLGDEGVVNATLNHPELWQVGLIEFDMFTEDSTEVTLTLVPGSAFQNTNLEFSSIPLNLTLEIIPDYDHDGDVDGQDYLVWQLGESPNPHSASDLAAWQAYLANVGLSAAVAVPEPKAGLIMLGSLGLLSAILPTKGRDDVRSHRNKRL